MNEELKTKIEEQLITLAARIVTNVSLHRKDLNSAFVTGTTNDLYELFQAERTKAKEEVIDGIIKLCIPEKTELDIEYIKIIGDEKDFTYGDLDQNYRAGFNMCRDKTIKAIDELKQSLTEKGTDE